MYLPFIRPFLVYDFKTMNYKLILRQITYFFTRYIKYFNFYEFYIPYSNVIQKTCYIKWLLKCLQHNLVITYKILKSNFLFYFSFKKYYFLCLLHNFNKHKLLLWIISKKMSFSTKVLFPVSENT